MSSPSQVLLSSFHTTMFSIQCQARQIPDFYHGLLVMLAGEPGIGKNGAAEELDTYAVPRGMRVLWGRSYEEGGAPAYWPWIQARRD